MAGFSQDAISVCVCVLRVQVYVLMYMRAFSFHALARPRETVMWAPEFNNFRGTIGDRNLKSTCPFPQQPRKEEEKGEGGREGGRR